MSKKQWFVLLGLLIIYILLGACFFYTVETKEEARVREIEREERKVIEGIVLKLHVNTSNNCNLASNMQYDNKLINNTVKIYLHIVFSLT